MDNNTYEIDFGRMNETIITETPSKAKYRFFKINNIADEYNIDTQNPHTCDFSHELGFFFYAVKKICCLKKYFTKININALNFK